MIKVIDFLSDSIYQKNSDIKSDNLGLMYKISLGISSLSNIWKNVIVKLRKQFANCLENDPPDR